MPLLFLVGVRNWRALQKGQTADTCPRFTRPILQAWALSFTWLEDSHTPSDLADLYRQAQADRRAAVVLLPE